MRSNAVISKLLISVSDYAEAIEVMRTDIDILDLKNPQEGALGALSLDEIRLIVKANNGCKQTSATIGDVPMQPHIIAERVQATLATEVDIVKIGFFGAHGHKPCIDAMKGMAQGGKLIAVLFADQQPDLSLLPKLRQAGFYGVMLDTAVKDGRNLLAHMPLEELDDFVGQSKRLGLVAGLAGSLRVDHIESLAALQADYLGFRGGVCEDFERRNKVSRTKILNLHHMLHKCNTLQVEC
jgi:uncharacterized protein (UPF0264 family)